MRSTSKTTFLSFHVKLIYNAICQNENTKIISRSSTLIKTDFFKGFLFFFSFLLFEIKITQFFFYFCRFSLSLFVPNYLEGQWKLCNNKKTEAWRLENTFKDQTSNHYADILGLVTKPHPSAQHSCLFNNCREW